MDTVNPPAARRRLIWPWVLGLCLAPFVILAAVVLSFVTLDRDAAFLRRHVMAATGGGWHTKVQLSVGRATLALVRTGLTFAHGKDIEQARLALDAVKCASVGVYDLPHDPATWSPAELLGDTDARMQRRGWTRLVGVAEDHKTVLIYTSDDAGKSDTLDLCLAVVEGRQLVVVSTTVDADRLADLVEQTAGGDLKHALPLALK